MGKNRIKTNGGELPEGWEWKTLGDIVQKSKAKATPAEYPEAKFIGMDCIESNSLRPSFLYDFKDFKSSGNYFLKGQVLYGRMRPYLNKVFRADFEGACSGEFIVLDCNSTLLPDYLKYILHSRDFVRFATDQTSGDRPRVTFEDIAGYPVFLPPLPEQERIVSKIEELFSELEKGKEQILLAQQQLKTYRQAVLASLIDADNLVTIDSIVAKMDQGWSPKCENEASTDHAEWCVIKTTAIQAGYFLQNENKRLPKILVPRKQHELKAGDLLITRAGPRVRVGVCCLVRATRPNLLNCDKVYRMRLESKLARPEYIEKVLNSPIYAKKIEEMKTGISDSGVNLTQKGFLQILIPLPSLEEQHRIVQEIESRLSVCDALEATLQTSLAQAEALRQSILKRAFEGQLV